MFDLAAVGSKLFINTLHDDSWIVQYLYSDCAWSLSNFKRKLSRAHSNNLTRKNERTKQTAVWFWTAPSSSFLHQQSPVCTYPWEQTCILRWALRCSCGPRTIHSLERLQGWRSLTRDYSLAYKEARISWISFSAEEN